VVAGGGDGKMKKLLDLDLDGRSFRYLEIVFYYNHIL
jgi:hypothetical protein